MAGLFSSGSGKYKAAIAASQAATQAAIERANASAAQLQNNFMLSQSAFQDRMMESDMRYMDAINAATSEAERQRLSQEAAAAAEESRRIADENRLSDLVNGEVAQISTAGMEELIKPAGEDILQPKRKRKAVSLAGSLGINL